MKDYIDIEQLLEKYQDEYRVIGKGPEAKNRLWDGELVRNTVITARENYLLAARHQKPEFMPVGDDEQMFSPSIFPDAIARAMVVDNSDHDHSVKGGKDMFDVPWKYISDAGGSMEEPGSELFDDANEWEKKIRFPDISKWDWELSGKQNAPLFTGEFPFGIWIMNGLFERLISFMGFENASVALIDEDQKDAVHQLFNRLAALYEEMIARIAQTYKTDILLFHDDWGSQRAPFFSPDVCREMIAPYLKRVVDAAHAHGMAFNFHCCGKNEIMVPVMIECGVDIWRGQYMNDFKSLYQKYGSRITFGVFYEPPTPAATREDVTEACLQFLRDFTGNGYAFPVTYGMPTHPEWFEILYSLSREYFSGRLTL